MKIIAKPIGISLLQNITHDTIASSALGKRVLLLINEGIEKKYLAYASVEDCIEKFRTQVQFGSCAGEASAILIAKNSVAMASKIDVICFQLLSNLKTSVSCAVYIKKKFKQIEANIKHVSKKIANKLKKEKNELKIVMGINKYLIDLPIQKLSTEAISGAEEFIDEIISTTISAIEEQSGYTCIKTEIISSNKCTFISRIKSIQRENKKAVLKLGFRPDDTLGHMVVLFCDRLAIYNSQMGIAESATKKEFLECIETLFDKHIGQSKGTVEIEIYT